MAISDVLDKWYSAVKRAAFRYKNGFFEFPLVSNSPETIIKSMSKMPMVYNDTKKEEFGSKNPFVNAKVPYHEIEKGLWIFYSQAVYKENVNYLRAKDKNISAEFYNLYLEINKNKSQHKNALLNGIPYSNSSWVIHKPFNTSTYCKFKGCETISLVLHFTETWLNNTLKNEPHYTESSLAGFFDSKAHYVIISDEITRARKLEMRVKELFEKKWQGNATEKEWEALAMDMTRIFADRFKAENIQSNMYDLEHTDRFKILNAEKILMDRLYEDFVGIDALAHEVGLSPTKLKSTFKMVYGDSVFQYFRSIQMNHAKQVFLDNTSLKVEEVALMFGYKNMTKFSNAFKETHGVFPSELKGVSQVS